MTAQGFPIRIASRHALLPKYSLKHHPVIGTSNGSKLCERQGIRDIGQSIRSKAFDNCLIRGKSGYIRGASTLAGRLDQESGQSLNFAIMVKNVKSSAEAKAAFMSQF